ncbi:MAG: hypothetical protein FJZ96_09100 [Chloroflexi bacterium]|nr:hypothetical protein [Chloroflexota bacterium]
MKALKQFPLKPRHILMAVGLVALVALVVDFNQRIVALDRLSAQLELVQAEGTAVVQTQEGLMTQVAFAGSEAAVERWAFVDGGWIRLGDHPVVVLPSGDAPPDGEQQSETPPPEPEPWQVWWELFFGDS